MQVVESELTFLFLKIAFFNHQCDVEPVQSLWLSNDGQKEALHTTIRFIRKP